MPAEPMPTPAPEALAVDAKQAARLCGVSRALWWKLDSSGRCPSPIRLGRRCVWPVDVLRAWLAAGCPPRDKARAERWRKAKAAELAALGGKR